MHQMGSVSMMDCTALVLWMMAGGVLLFSKIDFLLTLSEDGTCMTKYVLAIL
jgi:hypothetical protein